MTDCTSRGSTLCARGLFSTSSWIWAGGGATGATFWLESPPEMVRTSLPVRLSTRTTDTFPVSARGVNRDDVAEASAARMGEAASIAIAKQQIYTFLFDEKGPRF